MKSGAGSNLRVRRQRVRFKHMPLVSRRVPAGPHRREAFGAADGSQQDPRSITFLKTVVEMANWGAKGVGGYELATTGTWLATASPNATMIVAGITFQSAL